MSISSAPSEDSHPGCIAAHWMPLLLGSAVLMEQGVRALVLIPEYLRQALTKYALI